VKQIAHIYLGRCLNLFKLHPPSSPFLELATHTSKKSINSLGFEDYTEESCRWRHPCVCTPWSHMGKRRYRSTHS